MNAVRALHAGRPRRALAVAAIGALSCAAAVTLGAQVAISAPALPREETAIYIEKTGTTIRMLRQVLVHHEGSDGHWLELRSLSGDSDSYIRLDDTTLSPTYVEVTQRGSDAVIRRTTEVLQASPRPAPGELVVADFTSLPFTLRGLPWESFTTARLVALGSSARGQGFSLQLTLTGREAVTIGTVRYECFKVQLGVNGLWGAFVGKSSYWYTVDAPHYLVRSESPSGGPGSPVTVMELQSYSAR